MRTIKINKKSQEDYYKQRMVAHMAGGWRVQDDTKWYTDIRRNKTNVGTHVLLTLVMMLTGAFIYYVTKSNFPLVGILPVLANWALYRLAREEKRILKSIRQ